jgi:hypothetical protein
LPASPFSRALQGRQPLLVAACSLNWKGSEQVIRMSSETAVRSALNYTLDDGITLEVFFCKPEPGTVVNRLGNDPQEVLIHDAWGIVDKLSLDREGFELHDCPIAFDRFEDDAAVRSGFFSEVAEFVRIHSGAKRVHVFEYNIRSKAVEKEGALKANPVRLVHSDYTVKSGPQRVREVLPDETDDLLQRRFAFFNLWKPLLRVEELPLGVCDVASLVPEDMLKTNLRYPDRTGEVYMTRYSPEHR